MAGRLSLCVSRRLGGERGRVLTERAGVSEREQRRELLRRGLRRVAPRGPAALGTPLQGEDRRAGKGLTGRRGLTVAGAQGRMGAAC